MKSFLVPIGGSHTDNTVLETALVAARPFAAHLRFLHVVLEPGEAARYTPHMEFASGSALRGAFGQLEVETQARAAASDQHIHEFCARSNIELRETPGRTQSVTASCRQEHGSPLERILFYARHSDLIVMGRRSRPNGLAPDFLERLLLGSGRPLLIASASAPRAFSNIMVCWRESADAARAVAVAGPFLAQANRVIFATVAEKSDYTVAAMHDAVDQFSWHGVTAEVQIIAPNGRPAEEVLAAAARNCQADLVVAGAYGHSRMREIVFGGCTQSLIQHADRPILLMH
jgi:nucleotide-binding universal stress UspA family protein